MVINNKDTTYQKPMLSHNKQIANEKNIDGLKSTGLYFSIIYTHSEITIIHGLRPVQAVHTLGAYIYIQIIITRN